MPRPGLTRLLHLGHGCCSSLTAGSTAFAPCPPHCCSRVALGWVRVGGMLATLFGFYYMGAAMDDAAGQHPRHFYAATIAGRLLLSAAFAGLVAAGQCEPGLLWLAAANAASSALLWRAVRQRAAHAAAAAAAAG